MHFKPRLQNRILGSVSGSFQNFRRRRSYFLIYGLPGEGGNLPEVDLDGTCSVRDVDRK